MGNLVIPERCLWVHYGENNSQTDPRTRRFKGQTYHGEMSFDITLMTKVAPNLHQGGIIAGLILPPDIDHLVSLYPAQRYRLTKHLKTELHVSMADSTTQTFEQVDTLARWVNMCRETGPTLVHCQAGLNRSGLIVARALHLSDPTIWTPAYILAHLRAVRSPAVLHNPSFEKYVMSWA